MPRYRITLSDGRVVTLEAPTTPTEADVLDALGESAGPHLNVAAQPMASGAADVGIGTAGQVGAAVGDVGKGALAGAASTVFHGGDLIRRGLGMERVIDRPDVQAAMTPPPTGWGTAGNVLEQAAEFAVPLTKVSRITRGMGLVRRALAEGAASAGVAGVQTGGDTDTMAVAGAGGALLPFAGAGARTLGRAAQRAAVGAAEGGVGGAVAAMVRTAAPVEPKVMLVQALKPRSSQVNFSSSLTRAVPEIKAAETALGRPIDSVDAMLEATKAAKRNIQAQLDTLRGPQSAISAQVDLSPVADAMAASIPKKLALEIPEAAARLRASADVYRRPFTLDEIETLLRETNAELDGFYAMFPQAQRSARMTNPAIAQLDAQAKALRQARDAILDAPGEGAASRELNRRYGALLDVESEATRRLNVAARQQPESLSEQIGAVRAAADMARGMWKVAHGNLAGAADIAAAHAGRAAGKSIKESQTTDALIRRAFAAVRDRPGAIEMPPPVQIRGLLERGSLVTPPPADASFVRGVRGQYPQRPVALLPSHTATRVLTPPIVDRSGGGAVAAGKTIQRDPRTGRFRVIYSGGGK